MNYSETAEYLSDAEKYGIIPGLDSIKRLMNRLSDPQDKLKIVHISGTNGKGSVGAFMESVLREAGYSTGRFATPAVIEPLEIIQINGNNITPEDFSFFMTKVRNAADSIEKEGFPHPTVFEMQTAAAFCCFYEKKSDIVFIETGMGGTYDATNVISSCILSVITAISMDHMQFLGNTIEEIASHKAGIIKENGKTVTISQKPAVTDIIINTCKNKNSLLKISKIYNISGCRSENGKQYFSYDGLDNICLSMLGRYQTENAALAADACRIIADSGFMISDSTILKGLSKTRWPGRFEIIRSSSPVFVIDGAHNEAAAARLRESIDIFFADSRLTFIMGTFRDKEYRENVRLTAKRAEKIYTVTPPGKRGLPAEELAAAIREYNSAVYPCDTVKEAVKRSIEDGTDAVIAFGSLSFLSEIRKTVTSEENNDRKI